MGGLRGGGSIAGGGTGAAATEKKVSGVVKSEAPAVDGELDPAMVAKEVRTRLGAIKACYERGLKRDPQLAGTVSLRIEIGVSGRVKRVTVEGSTLNDAQVVECLVEGAQRWTFPGANVTVVYPIVLRPQH